MLYCFLVCFFAGSCGCGIAFFRCAGAAGFWAAAASCWLDVAAAAGEANSVSERGPSRSIASLMRLVIPPCLGKAVRRKALLYDVS